MNVYVTNIELILMKVIFAASFMVGIVGIMLFIFYRKRIFKKPYYIKVIILFISFFPLIWWIVYDYNDHYKRLFARKVCDLINTSMYIRWIKNILKK